MIKFTGKVMTVSDEVRPVNDKDKDGNKLSTTKDHRFTQITMIVKDGSRSVPILVKGFDLPSNFQLPKEGTDWETPEVTSYQSKFKAVPEVSIN